MILTTMILSGAAAADPSLAHLLTSILGQIDTWPRAAVMITFVAAFVILRWLKSTKSDVKEIKNTLTNNNGGSHVKDSLDRIEADQQTQIQHLNDLSERVSVLETRKWWKR